MAKTKTGKIHAILSRSHRTGRWRLSPKTSLVAFLGSCKLDLREAHLDEEISKMSATVILGGATIIIPPGVEVRPSGLSLFGGASVDVPTFDDNEAALIEIEWTSIFGRLRIGADFDTEDGTVDEGDSEGHDDGGVDLAITGSDQPASTPSSNGAAPPEPKAAPKPPPAIGFEDLDEPAPSPGIGFDDLPPVESDAAESSAGIGFDDLPPVEPAPAVGFEDLDEPNEPPTDEPDETPAEPAPAVGFEDLDEPNEPPTDEPDETPAEPAPAVGFEDL